jgi:pimeloyl-ACP methyl ester carboxylesterase
MTGATIRGVMSELGELEPVAVEAGRVTLRMFVGGEGDSVVLVHGLAATAAVWVDVAPRLVALGRRVAALELPGHGGSDRPPRDVTVEWFADAVADALQALDVSPALVVGHSLGGQVSLRLTERHPQLVRGLVLVCPAGMAFRRRTAALAALTAVRLPAAVATLGTGLSGRRRFRRLVFGPFLVADVDSPSPRSLGALVEGAAENSEPRPAGRAAAADSRAGWPAPLPCPALVLWGADDRVLPLDDGIVLSRAIGAPIRVVARCGHLLPVERPTAVVDAVVCLERG